MIILFKIHSFLKRKWYIPVTFFGFFLYLIFFNALFPGFLNSFTNELEETSASISRVRALGCLTTSVYYGETLFSYSDLFKEQTEASYQLAYDSIRLHFHREFAEIQTDSLDSLPPGKRKKYQRGIERFKKRKRKEFFTHPENREMVKNFSTLADETGFPAKGPDYDVFLDFVLDVPYDSFNYHFPEVIPQLTRKLKPPKKDLVYIGRGWVRAGFDLKPVPDSAWFPDSLGAIHLPQLRTYLLADINPWFIPELEIPGFEVLRYDAGRMARRRFTFREVTRIKMGCKRKLVRMALKKGLLLNARNNAEEVLLSFLQTLGNQGGDTVVSVHIPFPDTTSIGWIDSLMKK